MRLIAREDIFLLDGSGAVLTAVMHGLVLPQHIDIFGLPAAWLQPLGGLALCYAAFSFNAHQRRWFSKTWPLQTIALANMAFCLLTLMMACLNLQEIQSLGFIYLAMEIGLVTYIAALEWKLAGQP